MLIWFTVHVFRDYLSVCECASFPFGFEIWVWDLILLVPDHCLSFYLKHMGTSPCFTPFFSKEDNLYYILFASLDDMALPKAGLLLKENLLLRGAIFPL